MGLFSLLVISSKRGLNLTERRRIRYIETTFFWVMSFDVTINSIISAYGIFAYSWLIFMANVGL